MIARLTINRKLQFFASRARWGRRLRWFLAACALLSLVPFAPASINIPTPPPEKKKSEKKKDAPPPLPPQAVPVAVQVQNGGTVQVALRVYGRQEQTTKYLIRKEPQLGKIVSLEPYEREVWILTYQHTAPMNGQISQQDRILFAAQNKNGTSAAAELILDIVDNPPELAAPGSVEFGEIAAGIAATRSVTIANKGGGVLEGSVTADAPWSIEPSSYRLARGEQTALRLTLTPDAARQYQGQLHFSNNPQTEPAVSASAFVPFNAEPEALQLAGGPKGSARSASFTLTNRTAAELTLQVEANGRLHLPAQIILPPNATETVKATLAAEDPEGMDGSIRLSLSAIFRILSVHAASTIEHKAPPPPLAKATPTPPPAAPSHGKRPDVNPEALNAAVTSALGRPDELPKITGAAVVRTTAAGTVEFAWDRPRLPAASGELAYRVEIRRLSFDEQGKLLERWIAVPEVQFTQNENRISGLVTGIPPGISDTAHIVAVTSRGAACATSYPLPFQVPVPAQLFTVRNGLLAGFTLLLLCGLALRFQQKRSRAE